MFSPSQKEKLSTVVSGLNKTQNQSLLSKQTLGKASLMAFATASTLSSMTAQAGAFTASAGAPLPAIPTSAAAGALCEGTTYVPSGTVSAVGSIVKAPFRVNCSRNVWLLPAESASGYAYGGAGSSKGKTAYAFNSSAGSLSNCTPNAAGTLTMTGSAGISAIAIAASSLATTAIAGIITGSCN